MTASDEEKEHIWLPAIARLEARLHEAEKQRDEIRVALVVLRRERDRLLAEDRG